MGSNIFSADETADVGIDNQTTGRRGYRGKISKITLEVSPSK
jgi:hypothetical protein